MDELGPYEVVIEHDVAVTMRDGVALMADVYLPARGGKPVNEPVPALLYRTAYNRGGGAMRPASYFASHGYLTVTQDVRGTFASDGEFFAFVNEADDGVDTLNWLTAHPRCNGDIGMYGCSYMSWVQLALATQCPPSLRCLIPFGIGIDTFHHYAYPHGALQLGIIRWLIFDVWRRQAVKDGDAELEAFINGINFAELASQMPWQRGKTVLARSPQFEEMIFTYLEHRTYDDFWKQPGQAFDIHFDNFPDIPMLWVSGWYDGYPRSCCAGYAKLGALGRGEQQHLLLGPWVHNQMSDNICADGDFGPHADIARLDTQRRFFDRWLKCDPQAADVPHVRAFVMGGGSGERTEGGQLHIGGRWWRGDAWPPPNMTATPMYLHADRVLRADPPTQPQAATTYVHDPDNPVPSISPPWMFDCLARGPGDQVEPDLLKGRSVPGRPLAERPDVVVFQTPPLAKAVCVLGPLHVTLHVSSDAPDTDFAAKLVDVYPNGYGLTVAEGMLRMRYRNSDTQLELMEDERVYEVDVECFPAANLFAPGHRIRLDIASSNFPRHEINTNTGDPFSPDRRAARNTIHHDAAHRSCVWLPVIPAADMDC